MRVRLESVSHVYDASDESSAVQVLDAVSLTIASGDFAVLMGASGSGKSTLLNLIGAVDRPSRGRIFLDDVETSALDERGLTMLRRHSLGYIFQFFNLVPTLNVFENVAFPLSLAGVPRGELEARAGEVLERVGLTGRAKHFPTSSRAARCNAWPSAVPSFTARGSFSPTSLPAISTRRPASRSSS